MRVYKCKCDSCGEDFSSPEMYLSHRICPVAALAARDEVIRELAAKLPCICDYCDGSCAVCQENQALKAKALALIGSEQGTNKGEE